jgi:aminobenzoyl-glutamate utilization protein B
MPQLMIRRPCITALTLVILLGSLAAAAAAGPSPGRAVEPAKTRVLEFLGRPEVVERFGRISDAIWSYAELGLQEYKSSKLLADTLEKEGFRVERGLAGMPTCFVATYGRGKPVIGFLGEFDALPTLSQKGRVPRKDPLVEGAPGHGCGHNTMCTAAVAAAVALKQVLDEGGLPGTIKVFGSPAEETIISRPYMVRDGLFRDVDAVIDNHSGAGLSTDYGRSGNAVFSVLYSFTGRTAHAAGAPWAGRSALDAVEIMDTAVNFMREHMPLSARIHYVITRGGEAPNVVPDKASVWYYIRDTDETVEDLTRRVTNCAKAGALATETVLSEVRVISGVHQRLGNKALAEALQANIELVGMPSWSDEEEAFARALQKELKAEEAGLPKQVGRLEKPRSEVFVGGGSSDVAEVSLVAPTATVIFPVVAPGAIGHHWSWVACAYGSTAWKGLNAGAKVIAATALDLMTKPDVLKKVRDEFTAWSAVHPYRAFLPPESRPPLDLNSDLMKKWLPLLEPFALDRDVR